MEDDLHQENKIISEDEKYKNDNTLLFSHYIKGQHRLNEIQESIRYAQHIQKALFPDENNLKNIVSESFLFAMPKEDLTGDFAWVTRSGHKVIVAVADCTGHGIPGAMMSILGLSLLNQVVLEERCYEPSFILRRLDDKMRHSFEHSSVSSRLAYDGMDISVCCIDYGTGKISFAGAMRPAWIVSGESILELKGSRYPIGGLRLEGQRLYEGTEIEFQRGSMLYMFTDGYTDQFGGQYEKKISRGRLKKLVQMINQSPMKEQKEQLLEFFLFWKGTQVQTDDVTLMGVRL
jgi:serine phosphatase RsbU (regulator of sigma subunit)